MVTVYNTDINTSDVVRNLSRIGNQVFKLLPMREEGKDWLKPLETLALEVAGMSRIFTDQTILLSLLSKMEGLKTCVGENDFMLYRRTVFECCGLIDEVKSQCQ